MARVQLAPGSAKAAAEKIRQQQRHSKDPVAWMEEKLGRVMWSKTKEIARSVAENRYTAVHACHGIGKSFTAADIAAWWIDTHPLGTAVVVSTAPTWKQVLNILWKEIARAVKKAILPGYVTQDAQWKIEIDGVTFTAAFGRKPADHDETGFQGIHEEYVLVIIDEACGVPLQLWTAIDTLVTNANSRVLAIGNPDDPKSQFEKVCRPGSGWNVIHVSVFDWLKERHLYPSLWKHLTDPEWVEERKKRWGEKSKRYISKVLGVFPDVSEDTLFSPALIRQMCENDLPGHKTSAYGLDVARYGDDETCCYRNREGQIRHEWSTAKQDTMDAANRMHHTLDVHKGTVGVVVDGVGVGSGVVDRLRELGDPTIDFQGGQAAHNPKKFANRRAEIYWGFKQLAESGLIDLDEEDEDLLAQLGEIRWFTRPNGQIILESKEDMKKRLGADADWSSPDRADAAVMSAMGEIPSKKPRRIPAGGGRATSGLRNKKM